jgi:hypothetical protein
MESNKTKKDVSASAQIKEEKKYTESELNAACGQLYQKLMKEIQVRDMTNMFKRLDYLFEVVKNRDCFDDLFVHGCITEIQTALTPVESEDDENNVFTKDELSDEK